MFKKVGVFLDRDSYGASPYMAKRLAKALNRRGIETLFYSHGDDKNAMQIIKDGVEFTISFMDTAVSRGGKLLCDYIQVPHFTYLVDPSHCFFHHCLSKYSFLSSIDPLDAKFLKQGGFERVIHLPLAIDPEDEVAFSTQRNYPICFIGSCWDYKEVESSWEQNFTLDLAELMKKTSQETLASKEVSHLELFPKKLMERGYDITKVPYADMQVNIGLYIRGYERIKLLESIKKLPVHVWGSFRPKKSWDEYLKGQDNIHIHPPISYEDSLHISARTKILLNSSPQFKYGIHDRAMSAPLSGALLASTNTVALEESFQDKALLCPFDEMGTFEEKLKHFLHDDSLRKFYVERAKEEVLKNHTWDHRVVKIVAGMHHFITQMKEGTCKA